LGCVAKSMEDSARLKASIDVLVAQIR
jgi:hypothetical protein